MKKEKITCLLWFADGQVYVEVPFSVIRGLRRKRVVVHQEKEGLLQAIGRDTVLFFSIQKKKWEESL